MTENGTRTNRVGRHLPTSGGLKKTLSLAREQGLEAVQIFVSNPQGWAVPASRPDAEAFAGGAREIGLTPVVVHAKYLINLRPEPRAPGTLRQSARGGARSGGRSGRRCGSRPLREPRR